LPYRNSILLCGTFVGDNPTLSNVAKAVELPHRIPFAEIRAQQDMIGQSDRIRAFDDRVLSLGPGLAAIPERLLLAHARGEVLFIAGAGISKPAGLPDFRGLALDVYAKLDTAVHAVCSSVPHAACNQWRVNPTGLNDAQAAEVQRFINKDYDVALGMLERRMDIQPHGKSAVRQTVADTLRAPIRPDQSHRALMRLADRGGAVTIATTNFDLLLEDAAKRLHMEVETYALGGIPRPGRNDEFAGVLHIHGALDRNPARTADLVLTDRDFGEFYLRRRVVPDFIYDAARLFNLVLVGYSANDPPMRYLLNAVAADGTRFSDLKERFAFVGHTSPDPIDQEDWKGRGITPIPYDAADEHSTLRDTLARWADFSPRNGKKGFIDAEIRRIVRKNRKAANDADRDLFDHLIRRSDSKERIRLSALASAHKADLGWLDAIAAIAAGKELEIR
jgi:NAD-dependent SIR2 family protein deacetylase